VDTHLLLVTTAVLLAWQAVGILRGARIREREDGKGDGVAPGTFLVVGFTAGFVSGLLGIGGGTIMVPLMAGWLGMPLKVVLGTSLLTIVALVIPGTVVHMMLGHIDWAIFLVLTLGAVPGARVGAAFALGTKERTLRLMVGSFLLIVASLYGATELITLLRG
jgi:uncharacterized membrane protein YfcA